MGNSRIFPNKFKCEHDFDVLGKIVVNRRLFFWVHSSVYSVCIKCGTKRHDNNGELIYV